MGDDVTRKNASPGESTPQHFFGRVLKPGEMLNHARYSSVRVVAEPLRPFVKRYWAVEWDLPDGESYQTATVSEPTINLTFEFGSSRRAHVDGPGAWVTGPVTKRRFDVGIFGCGGVFGVNFHLGATWAFSDQEPKHIRDATVPAGLWFPRLDTDLGLAELFALSERFGVPDFEDLAASVENWLLSWRPQMTPGFERLKRALAILDDPEVVSVKILAQRVEVSERTLQRMFTDFCGVGVKKVLARARVIDAVGAIDRGWDGTLADLAAQFGWFDQSHFSADFVRVTGFSPAEYAQRKTARITRG